MRAILALAILLLAGCADAPAPVAEDSTFEEFDDVEATEDTGIIRGIVVDATITPIEGASVRLTTGEFTTTNMDGAFLFSNLEPGQYFLTATGLGYNTVQASTEVVAGVSAPPIVRLQLTFDASAVPYVEEIVWNGYIECGTNVVALCGPLGDLGVSNDEFTKIFDVDNNITHIQTEMVWSDTQELGDSFDLLHRYGTFEQAANGQYRGNFGSSEGPSPLLHTTSGAAANDVNLGTENEFVIAIFAGGAEGVGVAGAAVAQDFEMFIHIFHGYMPPEGWRFTDDSTVPSPQ